MIYRSMVAAVLLLISGVLLAAETQFNMDAGDRIRVQQGIFRDQWAQVPFDQRQFSYTYEEMEANWSRLMRGYQLPFPSPEYLESRYSRYQGLFQGLKYGDEDYRQHSLNALEVWHLFFRGDFQEAQILGKKYNGFALVPALLSQVMYAIYLSESMQDKHMLLQDAVDQIRDLSEVFRPEDMTDPEAANEYVMMRVGYAYAVGRIAEDVSIPTAIARNYIGKVNAAGNEIMLAAPDHPIGLALRSGIEANIIRRAGKAAGRLAFGANREGAQGLFEHSFELVPDLAITRYEYANSLLYVDKGSRINTAIEQLQQASELTPVHAMDALDIMYAGKRLAEIQALAASGRSFRSFDRKRRKYQSKNNINLYAVQNQPFILN